MRDGNVDDFSAERIRARAIAEQRRVAREGEGPPPILRVDGAIGGHRVEEESTELGRAGCEDWESRENWRHRPLFSSLSPLRAPHHGESDGGQEDHVGAARLRVRARRWVGRRRGVRAELDDGELEVAFHIFHRNPAATPSAPPSGTLLFALIALYPLVTIATLVLVIPLLMYVTDHTPFQSLNPLRPDHFARLVVRVYTAWLSNPGGKMKAKDL